MSLIYNGVLLKGDKLWVWAWSETRHEMHQLCIMRIVTLIDGETGEELGQEDLVNLIGSSLPTRH